MFEAEDQIDFPMRAPLTKEKPREEVGVEIRNGVRHAACEVIAQGEGIRVVRVGLRLDRYRQGV